MGPRWEYIEEFPQFLISDRGTVINSKTGAEIAVSYNQQGIAKIGLYVSGRIRTRGLALLVAKTFIPNDRPHFNSVINLDGVRENCYAENLMWRPRWFAIKYHGQFVQRDFNYARANVELIHTGERFNNFFPVCSKYGLYYYDIWESANTGCGTFPYGFKFRNTH